MTDRQDKQFQPGQEGRERSEGETRRDQDIAREYGEEPAEDLPGALGEEVEDTQQPAGIEETDDLEGGQYDRRREDEPIEGQREFEQAEDIETAK